MNTIAGNGLPAILGYKETGATKGAGDNNTFWL